MGCAVQSWPAAPRRYTPPCLDPAIPSSKMRRLVARESLCASVTPPAPAGGDVERLAIQRNRAPAELLEVEQVGQQPIELAGAGAEPPEQLGGCLFRHPTAGTLQGHGGAQDAGQWSAKLVRDGCQHAVPQLVEGGKSTGRLKFRHRPVGDIEAQALPVAGFAGVVIDQAGFVADPDHAPVAGDHTVRALPCRPSACQACFAPSGGVGARAGGIPYRPGADWRPRRRLAAGTSRLAGCCFCDCELRRAQRTLRDP